MSTDDTEAEPASTDEQRREEQNLASAQPLPSASEADAKDLFVVHTNVSEPASLTAFTWEVPEKAVVEHPFDPFDENPSTAFLEVVPQLGENASEVPEWSLYAFEINTNDVEPRGIWIQTSVSTEADSGVFSQTDEFEPNLDPFVFSVGYDNIQAGDEIGFVLGAKGSVGEDLSLAMRAITEQPDDYPEAPDALDDLEEATNETVSLPTVGSGEGMHVGFYSEFSTTLLPARVTFQTPTVTVQEDLVEDHPPFATVRETTVESNYEDEDGWALTSTGLFTDANAGTFEVSATAHEASAEASGPYVDAFGPNTGLAFGFPFAVATGGGSGSSEVSISTNSASVDDMLLLGHLALGEPVEDLLGEPAEDEDASFPGLVPIPVGVTGTESGFAMVDASGVALQMAGPPLPTDGWQHLGGGAPGQR